MRFLCLCVFALLKIFQNGLSLSNSKSQPIIYTEYGKIRGTQNLTVGMNVTYYSFRGIPYARPPVGDLRFEPPIPAQPWNGTLDATKDKSQCVQSNGLGSEDCLYLNVYTPKLPKNDSFLLSAMVFIYGGSFINGNSSYVSYGPDYLLEKNIIFVSMNYRLGLFGFGSTGDLVMPGNNGLKDQVLALKWIQKNIVKFGGNNQSITIFGESAGSVSVSYHLQSKKSQGLFQGAIMESGTTLCLWGLTRTARNLIFRVGEKFLINTKSSKILKNSLKKIKYHALALATTSVTAEFVLINNPKNGLFIGPVSEPEHNGSFFSGKSHDQLSKGDYNHVPTIIGFNSMEANTDMTLPIRVFLLKYDLNVTALPPIDLNLKTIADQVSIGSNIKLNYFQLTPISIATNEKTLQFITDDQFIRPIRQTVLQLSKYSPVFFYSFTYEGVLGGVVNRTVPGAIHTEELNYLFRRYRKSTKLDGLVKEKMVTLWTNFAKFGNPTPNNDTIMWTPVQPHTNKLHYLEIGKTLTVKFNPENINMTYWDNLYNKFGNPPYDTW